MNLAADECGWRRYPPAECPIRVHLSDCRYYEEADLIERFGAAEWARLRDEWSSSVANAMTYGTGWISASGPDGARAAKL